MRADEVKAALSGCSALLEGHFQLSSGLHSDRYVQCARALEDPALAGMLGAALAKLAPGVKTVVSPALGGILIGYEAARGLGARFLFAEREEGKMTLRRGFKLSPGERVVIVEDVITTGKSTGEVLALVEAAGAKAEAALAIVDRSGGKSVLSIPIKALLQLPLDVFKPEECPLCREGKPVVKPGSRPKAKTA
jgi:orotate phosphoribosyltransferase